MGKELDADGCYRALTARDARFDGVFYVGVSTTGVYCRPICPARTPRRDRCAFFARAAEAERAGYRACFRCRPELAPGSASTDALSSLARRAAERVEEGFLDVGGVDALASSLGVTSRHMRRAMVDELGVGPIELAETRRIAIAKQLVRGSALPFAQIAHASGFGSVRRFNAAFRARAGCAPSALRRGARAASEDGSVVLRLAARAPFDGARLLGFLGTRAVRGVEHASERTYARSLCVGEQRGWVVIRIEPDGAIEARVSAALARVIVPVSARLSALLDLRAHPSAIDEVLSADPVLAPSVRARPGLRVPGAVSGFEIAVRALLGQQVSVAAARTIAGRLCERFGAPLAGPSAEIVRAFPEAGAIAEAGARRVAEIGVPGARAEALCTLAREVASGGLDLSRGADPEEARRALIALPGIGAWTAEYVRMRALGWPDAFPAGDLVVRKQLGGVTAREAEHRSEAWRPFRAYAVMHLWAMASEDAHEPG